MCNETWEFSNRRFTHSLVSSCTTEVWQKMPAVVTRQENGMSSVHNYMCKHFVCILFAWQRSMNPRGCKILKIELDDCIKVISSYYSGSIPKGVYFIIVLYVTSTSSMSHVRGQNTFWGWFCGLSYLATSYFDRATPHSWTIVIQQRYCHVNDHRTRKLEHKVGS